jgi:hypothetical protein
MLARFPRLAKTSNGTIGTMIGSRSSSSGSARVLAVQPYNASERVTLLLLGALAIWFAIRAVSTGEIGLKFSTFRRSDNAPLFWFGIGMNILMGTMLLLGAIFGTDIWK